MAGVIQLPIPVFYEGKKYETVEIKSFTAGIRADTQKIAESGDSYKALQTFISGSIEKIDDIDDKAMIKKLVGYMKYKTAEKLIVDILLQDGQDDGIEGYYECPVCGQCSLAEFNEDVNLDTRDHLRGLETVNFDLNEDLFEYELKYPFDFREDEPIVKLSISFPTLNDCSIALQKIGSQDKGKLQLAILLEATKKINDNEIDKAWKGSYGMLLYSKINIRDINNISKELNKYGLINSVKKHCIKCGKEFDAVLNTSNFFALCLS